MVNWETDKEKISWLDYPFLKAKFEKVIKEVGKEVVKMMKDYTIYAQLK